MCINASQIYLEIDTRRNSSLSESELHGCWLKYCHSKVENLQSCAFYRWFHIELWHQFVCAGKVLDVSLLELLHICFLFTSLIQQDARQQGSWAEMVPNERLDSKNLEGLVCVKAGSQLDFYNRSMQTYQVVRTQTDCIGGWEQSGTERPSQRLGIFVGGRHWHWGVLMSWGVWQRCLWWVVCFKWHPNECQDPLFSNRTLHCIKNIVIHITCQWF